MHQRACIVVGLGSPPRPVARLLAPEKKHAGSRDVLAPRVLGVAPRAPRPGGVCAVPAREVLGVAPWPQMAVTAALQAAP